MNPRGEMGRAVPAWLYSSWTIKLSFLGVVLAVWEALGPRAPLFFSYPSEIITAFVTMTFQEDTLVSALAVTLHGFAVGYAIAVCLGVALGFAMGRLPLLEHILEPYINALYVTPRIVFVPLLVLWAGIDFELRVTIVTLAAIFPIIINVYLGSKNVDLQLLETAHAFVATEWQLLRTVIAPASLPYILAALRIGIARALIGIVVAEMTAALTGMGYVVIAAGRQFETDRLMVAIIVLGLLSILFTGVLHFVMRKVTPWARTQEVQ